MDTVTLKITGGKIILEIPISNSCTILDVKKNIKGFTNVDVGRQTLRLNNEELTNDKSIADYDIKISADLVLEVTPLPGDPEFEILVKYCGQDRKVKVKETTTVAELRVKMERVWVPSKDAILYCGLTKMEDDDAPLSAYYIGQDSRVEVKVIAAT